VPPSPVGGPIATVGYMQRDLVERRAWIDRQDFLDGVALGKGFHNSYKKWTGNDIRDADGVSAAIPYCDVVMTDNYVAAQLANSPAVARHGTLVLSRLNDLNDVLPDLIASRAVGAGSATVAGR
jgi:chromate transporter